MSATPEQRAAALDRANQIRVDRAILRTRIKQGEITASRVLADWPECIHGCGVFIFLQFLPSVGRNTNAGSGAAKAFVLLRKSNVPGHKRLDQLTPRQLERLARVVREYEDGRHPAERGLA